MKEPEVLYYYIENGMFDKIAKEDFIPEVIKTEVLKNDYDVFVVFSDQDNEVQIVAPGSDTDIKNQISDMKVF